MWQLQGLFKSILIEHRSIVLWNRPWFSCHVFPLCYFVNFAAMLCLTMADELRRDISIAKTANIFLHPLAISRVQ